MNTKGIKFLAVLAVLVMAFAAFAVIAPAEENDASHPGENIGGVVDVTTSVEIAATAKYYVAADTTVTVKVTDAGADAIFYVLNGKTLTVKGATGNLGDIIIYDTFAAPATGTIGKDNVVSESSVTVTALVTGESDIGLTYVSKMTDADTDTSSIYGKSNVAVAGVVSSTVTVAEGKALEIGVAAGLTNVKTVVAVLDTAKSTYYGNKATADIEQSTANYIGAIKLTKFEGAAGVPASAALVVTKSTTALMKFKGTMTDGELAVVNGSVEINGADTFTITAGTLSAFATQAVETATTTTLYPTGYATSPSTATYAYGNVSGSITQAYNASFELVKAKGTIVITQATDGQTSRTITVVADTANATIVQAGDVVKANTNKFEVRSGIMKVGAATSFPAAITAGTVINILAGAEIQLLSDTTVNVGTLNIYGKISIPAETLYDFATDNGGKINFGPEVNDVRPLPLADTAVIGNNIYGGAKAAGGIYNTDSTIDGAVLSSDIEITDGATLTVTGPLGLNNQAIIITKGKLVVESTGMIFAGNQSSVKLVEGTYKTNIIIIASKDSTFTNNGVVGANKPVFIALEPQVVSNVPALTKAIAYQAGISGVQYKYTKDGLGISGTAVASSELWAPAKPTLTVAGLATAKVFVTDDLTISTGAILNSAHLYINTGKNVVLKGELAAVENALFMNNNTSVEVAGKFVGAITAYVKDNIEADKASTFTAFETTIVTGAPTAETLQTVTGFTLSVSRTSHTDFETEKMYYDQRVYLDGKLTSSAPAPTQQASTTPTETFAISGDNGFIYIDEDSVVEVTTGKFTTGGTVVVNGLLTAPDNYYATTAIKGSSYKITVDAKATNFVTNFDDAFAAIELADNKTINVNYAVELDQDIEVLAGEKIVITGAMITIPEEFTMAVNKDASVTGAGIASVSGKLLVEYGGSCAPTEGVYDVVATDADKNKYYCGLQVALDETVGEVTITLSNNKIGANALKTLSLKDGQTLKVDAQLAITKQLSIAEGAKVIVSDSGSLIMGTNDTAASKVNVGGTLDLSEVTTSSFTGKSETDLMKITVTGEFKYNGNVNFTNVDIIGAKYTSGGVTVISTLEKAIENKASSITIEGEYTSAETIKAPTTLRIDGTAAIGAIDMSGVTATSTITVTGKLTATITGLSGIDSEATAVNVSEFVGSIEQKKATIASGDTLYTLTIKSMTNGSISANAGIVTLGNSITVGASKSLVVGEDAVLQSSADYTITNNGAMTINGDLLVDDGKLTIDTAAANTASLKIAGLVTVTEDGDIDIDKVNVTGIIAIEGKASFTGAATVTGSILIDDSEESVANVTVNGGSITLGQNSLAADAILSGKFTLVGNGAYLAVFPGAIVDELSVKDLRTTEIYLNGVLYMTQYAATAGTAVKVYGAADGVIKSVVKIEGFDMSGMADEQKWKDEEGNYLPDGAFPLIGAHTYLSFDGVAGTVTVKVSSVKGVSVFVDGVNYASGSEVANLKVGTHTVTATIDPGYKGTTAVTFNGKSVTSSFEITKDMVDVADMPVLSATGDISIDTGDIPAPEKESEWTITTILLVVLIILIAVMVIVVLLRMNRS